MTIQKFKITRKNTLIGLGILFTALIISIIILFTANKTVVDTKDSNSSQNSIDQTNSSTDSSLSSAITTENRSSVSSSSMQTINSSSSSQTSSSKSSSATIDNIFTGKKYNFSFKYPSDWYVKSYKVINNNVESVIIAPKNSTGVSFNMSVYPQPGSTTIRKDYEIESQKQVSINGKTYTSYLYKPADWTGISSNLKEVHIDLGTKPDYSIDSSFDSSKVSGGWDIINNIAKTLSF